jgi:hypothetical protein
MGVQTDSKVLTLVQETQKLAQAILDGPPLNLVATEVYADLREVVANMKAATAALSE